MNHFNFGSQNPNPSSSSSSSVHGHNSKSKTINTKQSTTRSTSKLSTDPQSVAARERRHRISDRFKVLQSMVPGGAKMDTVSILDEAISYVKLLKAQIWFHQNMLLICNDNELTSSCTYNDDYNPLMETYLQGMPPTVIDNCLVGLMMSNNVD